MRDIATEAETGPHLIGPLVTSCPECGSREVETVIAPPGERERAIYLRCRSCGQERTDLDFYEES